jgi:hypothetical protein
MKTPGKPVSPIGMNDFTRSALDDFIKGRKNRRA